jgi:hypothetical protein
MTPAAKDARDLIAFYLDAGVDALLGEEPIDRFADQPQIRPSPAEPKLANDGSRTEMSTEEFRPPAAVSADRPPRSNPPMSAEGRSFAQAAPASPEAAVMAARAAARSAQNLDALRALLDTFEGCMLRTTATQLVFADGNPKGRVMFVGEGARRRYRRPAVCRPFGKIARLDDASRRA